MLYENLVGFARLGICIRVICRLWQATHSALPPSVPSPKRKTLRPLKPRPPHDCLVCGRPHSTPLVGNARKPGVLPWREHKSARGKHHEIYLGGPRKAAPFRLKTVLRHPVEKARQTTCF